MKKYSIELRVRVLEDLKNGVGMKTVVETHQLANRRCVKYTLHRLQGEPMYIQSDPKKFMFVCQVHDALVKTR